MYCSSCGVVVVQGLSYCKNCGAKLNRGDDESKSSEVSPDTLVSSMVATFILGLMTITVLMGVMKAVLGLPVGQIIAFLALPFLLIVILEGVFIRLLLRRTKSTLPTIDTKLSNEQSTNELDATQVRALPEGMPSVTEHTTRAFDPNLQREKIKISNEQ
jgi:hypothetical protein